MIKKIQFPIHHKKEKMNSDRLSSSNDIENISFENVILATFGHATALASDLNIPFALFQFIIGL